MALRKGLGAFAKAGAIPPPETQDAECKPDMSSGAVLITQLLQHACLQIRSFLVASCDVQLVFKSRLFVAKQQEPME